MPDIKVKTVKGFDNQGEYAKRGSTITVDEFRAADLFANGLIEDYKVKKAEEPGNKKAAEPANKAAAKQKTKAE